MKACLLHITILKRDTPEGRLMQKHYRITLDAVFLLKLLSQL
jgi:hypothetical protein